jgi:DNA-binding beta-propeller fold protein YncE
MFFVAAPAQGAVSDPLFVFTPAPSVKTGQVPPPAGALNGPCGLGVNPAGRFYVSDYYHRVIDTYDQNADYNSIEPPVTGATGYLGQVTSLDPLDGPCGMAFGAAGALYVNEYHRSVINRTSSVTIAGAGVDSSHPTGVDADPASGDVYVDARDRISVYDESGAPIGEIGGTSLIDGYGIAYSRYPGTQGYLYVPDAATSTVKVYDPSTDTDNPIAEIDAAGAPNGEFVSLRDAAIAVDRVTGEVYVIDDLQPIDTERPKAVVYIFSSTGAYEGHLKFLITDALPAGLAVDNTETATQGRVYVTSGNTENATIYAYGPGAATSAPLKSSTATLALTSRGAGEIQSSLGPRCESSCEEEVHAGATVTLSAEPDPGSAFAGWSGACEGSDPTCSIRLEEAASVRATFSEELGPPATPEWGTSKTSSAATPTTLAAPRRQARYRKKNHHRRHRAHRAHRRGVERGR